MRSGITSHDVGDILNYGTKETMNVQVQESRSNQSDGQASTRESASSQSALTAAFTYEDIEAEALERLAHKGFDWMGTLEALSKTRGARRPLAGCI